MTIQRQAANLAVVLCMAVLAGCPGNRVTPGHDPLLVEAERTAEVSFETVQLFLEFERDNRELLATTAPQVTVAADKLKAEFPAAFRQLRSATSAYKAAKAAGQAGDSTTLENKLQTVAVLARIARESLTKGKASVP